MRQLSVGDQVIYQPWSGNKKVATVEAITICREGEKYGRDVNHCDLDKHRNGVLDLDNEHWCYFYQVKNVIKKQR